LPQNPALRFAGDSEISFLKQTVDLTDMNLDSCALGFVVPEIDHMEHLLRRDADIAGCLDGAEDAGLECWQSNAGANVGGSAAERTTICVSPDAPPGPTCGFRILCYFRQ
jgi:hypothetical protein